MLPYRNLLFRHSDSHTNKVFFDYLHANNQVLKEIASEMKDCGHLDVGPFDSCHFGADGMHFNGEGICEMASRVAEEIGPLVRSFVEKRIEKEVG